MIIGNAAIWLALALCLVALVSQVVALRRPAYETWSRRSTFAMAAILATTFLFLCLLFLNLAVEFEYVWLYTGSWIPWEYRLAGAWTGREGSLLLWTAFMAATAAVMQRRKAATTATDEATAWTRIVMLGLLSIFLFALARQGLFDATAAHLLQGRPTGNGINPTLRSPFILIHPPMMFLAYAITIVPAAAGISHFITGTGQWSAIAGRPARVNWILYTFAMGLGGIWAYYTLGFGGYWAWDPVEVANLLPWLALTIYLHAQMIHARTGHFAAMGPMLGILPFVFTVFSTVSTRSGLWVSVHAFTDPSNAFNPDAAGRLLGILGIDASLGPYFGILLATMLIGLALWCRRVAIEQGVLPRASRVIAGVLAAAGTIALLAPIQFLAAVFDIAALTGSVGTGSLGLLVLAWLAAAAPMLITDSPSERGSWITVRGLASLSIILLSVSLLVSVLWHFGAVNGWSEKFWDDRIPWLLTPTAGALLVLLLHGQRGRKVALYATGGVAAASVVSFLIGGLGAYALAWSIGVFLAGLDKLVHVGFVGGRPARAASLVLWIGALLNVIVWFNPPSSLAYGLFEPRWPIQLPLGLLSLAGLAGAHGVAAGRPWRWPYLLVAALGALFLLPAVAAAVALGLHSRWSVPTKPFSTKRLRMVAVYGVHLVVGMLMVGYSASTYYEAKLTDEFQIGDDLGMDGPRLLSIVPDGNTAGQIAEIDVIVGGSDANPSAKAAGQLYYEEQTGAYYPLPGALRSWSRDVYIQVDAICFQAGGNCTGDDWLVAYESNPPLRTGDAPTAARLTVHSLPGISLVWAALALFVSYGIPIAFIRDPAAQAKRAKNQ